MRAYKLIVLLFLATLSAHAAISLTQHSVAVSAANAVTIAKTVTSTGSGNLLITGLANAGQRTVTGCTDNIGNTWVQAASAAANWPTLNFNTDIYYVLSGTSGVTTVTCTFSGVAGTFDKEAWFFEVSGCTSCAFDGAAPLSSGSGVASVYTGASVTTTGTTGFAVGIIQLGSSVDQNPNSGNEFSAGGDISVNGNAGASLISSTAAAHTPVWHGTTTNSNFCSSTATFKLTSGAVTTPKLLLLGVG